MELLKNFYTCADGMLGVFVPAGRWKLSINLSENGYLAKKYYDGRIMIDTSGCENVKTRTKKYYECINFSKGIIKIRYNRASDALKSEVISSFNSKINDLDSLYAFLEKLAKVPYKISPNNDEVIIVDSAKFKEEGGDCKQFSIILKNELALNGIEAIIEAGTCFNSEIESKKYFYNSRIGEPVNHSWVEFKMNNKWYLCDPAVWSTHLNNSKNYEQELKWLIKNAVYPIGISPNLMLRLPIFLKKKGFNKESLGNSKIKIELL